MLEKIAINYPYFKISSESAQKPDRSLCKVLRKNHPSHVSNRPARTYPPQGGIILKQPLKLKDVKFYMPSAKLTDAQTACSRVSQGRHSMPSTKLAYAQAPSGSAEKMFQVPFAEGLGIVTPALTLHDDTYCLPPLNQLTPPIQLLFPELQPCVRPGAIYVEGSFNVVSHERLLQELGVPCSAHNQSEHSVIVLAATGCYQRDGDTRQFLLQRYDQAAHAILQIFWMDGYGPSYHSVNSAFGQRQHALEVYRKSARGKCYGSDTWILELHPESIIYQLARDIIQYADRLISDADISLQAEQRWRDYIQQLFANSGVVKTINSLAGWCIEFGETVIVLGCTDRFRHQAAIPLRYTKFALEFTQELVMQHLAGQLNLVEAFGPSAD